MKITTKFNIWMTFVFIVHEILLLIFEPDDDSSYFLNSMFRNAPILGMAIALLLLTIAIVISIYCTRALWNRLFPHLCGWQKISLAESYALSLFLAFLW
ncbi:MAG: hypothetical protein AAGG51_13655 [Cyanobacteria bacterium P01_G01_bin.54]